MEQDVIDALIEKQKANFREAILNLYCTTIYSAIDSSCALPAEIDSLIYELEIIYNEHFFKKRLK